VVCFSDISQLAFLFFHACCMSCPPVCCTVCVTLDGHCGAKWTDSSRAATGAHSVRGTQSHKVTGNIIVLRNYINFHCEDDCLLGCCAARGLLLSLMMEAANTSETSVNFYQTTRRNNPEDSHFHSRCPENLKSHNVRTRSIVWIPTSHVVWYRGLRKMWSWRS
jgi:hypothetical protein